jgi:hypothetical protein
MQGRANRGGGSARRAQRRVAVMGVGVTAIIAIGGCGGDDSSDSDSGSAARTVTEVETAPPAPTPTPLPPPTSPSPAEASSLPSPPSGSKEIQEENEHGVTYGRYSTGDEPSAVVAHYRAKLKADGWTIENVGGSSGGWGKYGGAEAGLQGRMGSEYIDVQAGGSRQGPTYFEVCIGPEEASEQQCANISDGPDGDDSDRDEPDTESRGS